MSIGGEDRRVFEELEPRLRSLLSEQYQDRYDQVQSVSMGTAGGPAHKGALLEPATSGDIEAEAAAYAAVLAHSGVDDCG